MNRAIRHTGYILGVLLALVVNLPGTAEPKQATTICFYRDLDLACVQRSTQLTSQPAALLELMLTGPTPAEQAQGIYSALPPGARLNSVEISGDAAIVRLDLPADFLYGKFDPLTSDLIVRQVAVALEPLDLRALTLQARDRDGVWRRLSDFLSEPPPVHKHTTTEPVFIPTAATPALSGKTVYLSAGHGWYWSQSYSWKTQRGNTLGLVEDFNNAEVINQYLIQYLRNAGAEVWTVREQDMNAQEIIVTHDSPDYADEGDWITSVRSGYGGAQYRYAIVSATVTCTATWAFTPAVNGRYAIYVWYAHGRNRAPDARYLVQHAGGITEVRLNQTVHGYTWRYLGTFPFRGGSSARVLLTNQSLTPGRVVIADAIRIGGGMGSLCGDTPGGCYATSGRPRWEEAARYWAKYQGAPPSVYDPVQVPCRDGTVNDDSCDDVTARPLYAEWEKPDNEDAVYISWHTNGYNGTTRGTESYIYDGAFTPGSDALQAWVHTTLINDIRAGWDPNWIDRGRKRRDLGEVRMLSTMPGVLLEIAFHDHPEDVKALQDPRFEQLAARAVYKGIVRYFANRDRVEPVILPEPPQGLTARNIGPGTVRLDWLPSPTDEIGLRGDAATFYRVYTSTDGFGWSNEIAVTGTTYTLSNLPPGQLIFARVTGVNAGGESFPSSVAGARVGWPPSVLIVDGFGRIDRRGLVPQNDGGSLGVNYRMFLDRINTFDYVIQHGSAITLPFDSANRRALGSLPITLGDYAIIDWIAGEEQSQSDPLPPNAPEIALSSAEQAALQSYVAGGGSLFISGSELGYDLVYKNRGPAFYANVLKATYLGDDADTYTVAPVAGSIFDGLGLISFDDSTHGIYNADWPDYLDPSGGATSALTYVGGQGHSAGVQYDSGGCSRVVYLGFPFETIYDAAMRQAMMNRIIGFLGKCVPPETTLLSPQPNRYYNYVPEVSGLASHPAAGIASVQLQVISGTQYWNGAGWTSTPAWLTANGTTAWNYALPGTLSDGWYTIAARAWSVTNIPDATPAQTAFGIDTVAPTGPAPITPTNGVTISGVGATLVYSPASDATLAGHVIEIDGHLVFTTDTRTTFRLPIALADGTHTWRVWAFDRAGNQSPPSDVAHFATTAHHIYLPVVVRLSAFSGQLSAFSGNCK